jgi:hypothetical protein
MTAATAAWRVWLPAVALVTVAACQIALTRYAGLTAWKGGGFGMFATVDGGSARAVRIVAERDGRSEEVLIAPSLARDADRAAAFPVSFMLAAFAERVVAREQQHGRPLDRLTVEVVGASLSEDGSQAKTRRLAVYVLETTDATRR